MMKELLVMVSEEFRKEYHDTTGKIYRNLKSSVESFMIEDGIVTVIYTDERSKVRTTLHIPEKHYIGCLEFDGTVDRIHSSMKTQLSEAMIKTLFTVALYDGSNLINRCSLSLPNKAPFPCLKGTANPLVGPVE